MSEHTDRKTVFGTAGRMAGIAAGAAASGAVRMAGNFLGRLGAGSPQAAGAREFVQAFRRGMAGRTGEKDGSRALVTSKAGGLKGGSRYAAAQTTRLGEGWIPVTKTINEIINSQSGVIRARVQQLVRDMPYFKRARDVMVNYTVGRGIRYEPKVMGADGKLAREINRTLEDGWNRWSDEADLARKMDLYGMMRLSKGQEVEAGEYLCVLVTAKQPGRFLPVGIRTYEPEWLSSEGARGEGGSALWDAATGQQAPAGRQRGILGGVEYDLATGEILAYHLKEPGSTKGAPVRVPAQWVIHGHEVIRPNQLRGISPFVTAILIAHSLNEIMGSELDAAQMASKWLAFVETPGNEWGIQQGRITGTETGADGTIKQIEHLENCIVEYVQAGQKVNFASANRPGNNFEPFVRLIIRMVAITTGTSYELLSGDYSGLAYSNLKSIRNDLLEGFDPLIDRHVYQQCKPLQRWFLSYGAMTGALYLPGYDANPARFHRAYWQPSGHRLLDPLRETKANTEQVRGLTKSPQEICAERGRDFEDVLEEISSARDLAAEKGLNLFELLGMVATTTKNNPAALGAEEEGQDKAARTGKERLCLVQ